ncbi:MAG TPA: triose-phosphate isomerase, partial [Erythrobacter sp.]|nr:triose-phosphate isomerase [Erythrobacter sp.]
MEARDAGEAESFVLGQLRAALPIFQDPADRLTIAYEPIW